MPDENDLKQFSSEDFDELDLFYKINTKLPPPTKKTFDKYGAVAKTALNIPLQKDNGSWDTENIGVLTQSCILGDWHVLLNKIYELLSTECVLNYYDYPTIIEFQKRIIKFVKYSQNTDECVDPVLKKRRIY